MNSGRHVKPDNKLARFYAAAALASLLTLTVEVLAQENSESENSENFATPECVVLLHGMGRTSMSMWYLSRKLSAAGFYTVNHNYPSTKESIEELAETEISEALEQCPAGTDGTTHFVTHSLGGIVVRYYLQTDELPEGSRVVMLAPPNQGSELASRFADIKMYEWLTGPAGQELGTDDDSVPNQLEPVNTEIGIIAGKNSVMPWFSRLLPEQDDGLVSVESTKLENMDDFLIVDATHTFIMNDSTTINNTIHFLETGRFLASVNSASISSVELLRSNSSWDGGQFFYPDGDAEITSTKIKLEDGEITPFHCHPVPTMAYILGGSIEVETTSGESLIFHEGESLVEVMNTVHRGKALDGEVELVVFYAGAVELPHTLIPNEADKNNCPLG